MSPKASEPAMNPPGRIGQLARVLRQPLPEGAHRLMWPKRLPQRGFDEAPADARLASVLVLLYEEEGHVRFPLQRRTAPKDDPHGGQISLPGGSKEGSETPEQTALREAEEELGIDPARVEILGRLSRRWIPVSQFKVQTVVGWTPHPPDYRLDVTEVDQLIISSLEELEESDRLFNFERESPNYGTMSIPAWRLDAGTLWGATAMILAELIQLVRRAEGAPPLRGPGS